LMRGRSLTAVWLVNRPRTTALGGIGDDFSGRVAREIEG